MFSAFMSIKSVMRGIVEFRLSSLLLSYALIASSAQPRALLRHIVTNNSRNNNRYVNDLCSCHNVDFIDP